MSAGMSMTQLLLQAGEDLVDEGIHFRSLPPNYVAWFLIPLAILGFSWFLMKRERNAPPAMRVLFTLLRGAAFFFIVLLLFDPHRQFRKVEEIRSMVTVLVDESASMAHADPYEANPDRAQALVAAARLEGPGSLAGTSRSDLLKRVLGPDGSKLIDRIREKHDVKLLGFASGKLRPLDTLADATAEGPVTAIGDAIGQALADPDIQVKPNTSIVLISDGRSNGGAAPEDIARHAGKNDRIPVHTVAVGDPDSLRDLELRFIRADEVVLKGNTLRMELTVRNRGFGQIYAGITVVDQDGRPWTPPLQKRLEDVPGDQDLVIDVPVDRPAGNYSLTVTVATDQNEENRRNNSRKHPITVKDDLLRVLYVDTLPRWEYRRLKDYLVRGDQAFRANCLLLSAEPNFIQEFTPVAGMQPIREFPREFAELDQYDVLVFGDVDPNLLTPTPELTREALQNIERFVNNGGGLAVICGDGWTPRAYLDSPIEEILPVELSATIEDGGPLKNYVDEWKPKLSAFGRAHPIMQLRADPARNLALWEERNYGLMELRWCHPVSKAKPAAQVLAFHPHERNRFGPLPIFVVGNYGDGPVFFSAVDETWRWFHLTGPHDFNRFWGNVVRYLARSHLYRGSKRYKLISDASEYRQGETVELTAYVKDKSFAPETAPTQRVMITAPDAPARLVEFENKAPGEYRWSFKPASFGDYEAWIVGPEGLAGQRYAPISFAVNYVDAERQDAAADAAMMRSIAEKSEGGAFELHQAQDLLSRLKADTTRRSSVSSKPLKSRTWLPVVPLLLLTCEWLLRRRYNMA
ncbi:MAG: hypothetical protein H6807_02465 [Planctomycetes bacterium]|nr:hypothetical protein [Planctomycetota bacterium]